MTSLTGHYCNSSIVERKESTGKREGREEREKKEKQVFINNSSLQLIKGLTGVLARPLVNLHGNKLVPAPGLLTSHWSMSLSHTHTANFYTILQIFQLRTGGSRKRERGRECSLTFITCLKRLSTCLLSSQQSAAFVASLCACECVYSPMIKCRL